MSNVSQDRCRLPQRASIRERVNGEPAVPAHSHGTDGRRASSRRSHLALRWGSAVVTTGLMAWLLASPAAAVTIETPPQSSQSATVGESDSGKVAGQFGVEKSWATVKSTVDPTQDALSEQPGAASRARYRVPVTVKPCMADAEIAANGSRQVIAQSAVYMPMKKGAFSFSSSFGFRIHPVLGVSKLHSGDDYSAPEGTPIYATADGVVSSVASDSGRGNYVVIAHTLADKTKFTSWYLHQYTDQILVKEGDKVAAGQQIGAVGSSGLSTGPHLHFEIHNSKDDPIDPSKWLEDQGAVYLGEDC